MITFDQSLSWRYLCVIIILFCCDHNAHARGEYLGWWGSYYPDSISDDISCQLCHQSDAGGNGWNYYGWRIRETASGGESVSQFTLTNILRTIEDEGSEDPGCGQVGGSGATFLDEIRYNAQPGWSEGSNNIRLKLPSCASGSPNPALSNDILETADLPAEIIDPITDPIVEGSQEIELYQVATNFRTPVKAVTAPGINGSIFVVEKFGTIYRVDLATRQRTQFLDISSDLDVSCNECGLLGLAFHPNFAANGLFYTYQSEPREARDETELTFPTTMPSNVDSNHRSIVVEYRVQDPSCNSSISIQDTLMVIDQPQGNHNGGDLVFDQDNLLYISIGDGGSSDDRATGHGDIGNSRDTSNPLGTILRIDPLGDNSANGKYGIPIGNPFASSAGLDEIFAYGFRNPYRISYDVLSSSLYAADVGQNELEEIDIVSNGGNYGWNWKEGSRYFYTTDGLGTYISADPPAGIPSNLVEPIAEYDHQEGRSVTGGHVYRGDDIVGHFGKYTFADYTQSFSTASGRLFYLESGTDEIKEFDISSPVQEYFTGFGQDADNELYVLGNKTSNPADSNGTLYKLIPVDSNYAPPNATEETAQCPGSDEICIPIKAINGNTAVICL